MVGQTWSNLVKRVKNLYYLVRVVTQNLREPTIGEITYMKAQEAIMGNSTSHVEEANFVNNKGYIF